MKRDTLVCGLMVHPVGHYLTAIVHALVPQSRNDNALRDALVRQSEEILKRFALQLRSRLGMIYKCLVTSGLRKREIVEAFQNSLGSTVRLRSRTSLS